MHSVFCKEEMGEKRSMNEVNHEKCEKKDANNHPNKQIDFEWLVCEGEIDVLVAHSFISILSCNHESEVVISFMRIAENCKIKV